MKWKNHKDMARGIAKELDLPPHLAEVLIEGSIQPDKNGDLLVRHDRNWIPHRSRMRHHRPDRRYIMILIWKARRALLESREEDAIWCLGRAIHYIQDLNVARGIFGLAHDSKESDIGEYEVAESVFREGIRNAVSSPRYVWKCLKAIKPISNPATALSQAAMYSATISAAVLGDTRPEATFEKDLARAKRIHWSRFAPLSFGMLVVLSAISFFIDQIWFVIPSFVLALLIFRLDLGYYAMREEAIWYGLE